MTVFKMAYKMILRAAIVRQSCALVVVVVCSHNKNLIWLEEGEGKINTVYTSLLAQNYFLSERERGEERKREREIISHRQLTKH